jgi:hypothetical protein
MPQKATRELQNLSKTSWDFVPPVQEPALPSSFFFSRNQPQNQEKGGHESGDPKARL